MVGVHHTRLRPGCLQATPTMLQQLPRLQTCLSNAPSTFARFGRLRHQQVLSCAVSGESGLSTTTSAPDVVQQQQPHQQQEQQLMKQWSEQSSVYYSNYPLYRAAQERKDETRLASWFNAPGAKVTPVSGSRILLKTLQPASSNNGNGSSPDSNSSAKLHPVWISPASDLGTSLNPEVPPLFLGLDDAQTPHFAVQVTADTSEALASSQGAKWMSARTAGPELNPGDAAVMAVASGLAQWNLDAQYHGSTGAKTLAQDGGFSRKCSSSGRVVYPRIDPAIITLVTSGPDWCLLGRKAGWPAGRYSTLAGFLELGETLEQALCREVLEESGVVVDLHSVRYIASQPWPFPRSLMVGFYAAAAAGAAAAGGVEGLSHQGRMAMMDTGIRPAEVSDALQGCKLQPPKPQEDEMEDVRWFHRDWLHWALKHPESVPQGFFIPGNYSLAYKLITGWLSSSSSSSSSSSGGSSNGSSSSSWVGDEVPQVSIDEGVFKYVLLRLSDRTDSSRSKLLVRGSAAAAYHNHILQHTKAQVQHISQGALDVEVLGGGRIEHYPGQKVISVYGYSAAFGPAVHEVTVGLLKKWFPLYDHITFSYEGY